MSYLNTHKHRQSSYLRAYYLRAYKAHSTIVENVRQISLFLQNKPNSPIVQLDVTYLSTMNYTISQSDESQKQSQFKPNTKPKQSQFPKGQK